MTEVLQTLPKEVFGSQLGDWKRGLTGFDINSFSPEIKARIRVLASEIDMALEQDILPGYIFSKIESEYKALTEDMTNHYESKN